MESGRCPLIVLFLPFYMGHVMSRMLATQCRSEGAVVECLTRDRGTMGSSLTGVTALCPWARHINPILVLVQPRKTLPYITESLLMERKESNQTNKTMQMRFPMTRPTYRNIMSKNCIHWCFMCLVCRQTNFLYFAVKKKKYEPPHAILVLITLASSYDSDSLVTSYCSDKPAHSCSLTRAFASCLHKMMNA